VRGYHTLAEARGSGLVDRAYLFTDGGLQAISPLSGNEAIVAAVKIISDMGVLCLAEATAFEIA
jgi:hypothetical protein